MRLMAIAALAATLAGSAAGQEWQLVWADEFTGTGMPDDSKWGYDTGFMYNNEEQFYTLRRHENVRVEDGILIIEARLEKYPTGQQRETQYTSGRLKTEGRATWTYGKVEVRAKLPTGRGMWPAIWMLGAGCREVPWPKCGEIDIMENVGFDPDVIHANIHTQAYNHVKKTNKGAKIEVPKPWADFHIYAVEWTPEQMDFFVDGKKYFTYRNEKTGVDVWPFDQPFYLILNVAVGGTWGGQKGVDQSIFPQRMEVDWVRVYQKK